MAKLPTSSICRIADSFTSDILSLRPPTQLVEQDVHAFDNVRENLSDLASALEFAESGRGTNSFVSLLFAL
jgi:hypothetical protein